MRKKHYTKNVGVLLSDETYALLIEATDKNMKTKIQDALAHTVSEVNFQDYKDKFSGKIKQLSNQFSATGCFIYNDFSTVNLLTTLGISDNTGHNFHLRARNTMKLQNRPVEGSGFQTFPVVIHIKLVLGRVGMKTCFTQFRWHQRVAIDRKIWSGIFTTIETTITAHLFNP